jgi:hypothetical protein
MAVVELNKLGSLYYKEIYAYRNEDYDFFGMCRRTICYVGIIISDVFAASIFSVEKRPKVAGSPRTLVHVYKTVPCFIQADGDHNLQRNQKTKYHG